METRRGAFGIIGERRRIRPRQRENGELERRRGEREKRGRGGKRTKKEARGGRRRIRVNGIRGEH